MGEIIDSKFVNGKVMHTIILGQKEALQLKGRLKNIHLFCSDICDANSKIIIRGRFSSQCLSIPKKLKLRESSKLDIISCQRIESENKVMFIFICDKLSLKQNPPDEINLK